jgi:uncharacterized Fe-S cluster-containing radical SAM superfamily protein
MSDRSVDCDPGIAKAYSIIHEPAEGYRMTDLTKSVLEEVQSPYFRLFTPVKLARKRLPTSLPEFWMIRHQAALSDSPVTAAAALGGHWSEHNLAAITQVGACNFRCNYCYVDFRHLAGHESFVGDATSLVADFVKLRRHLADSGQALTILRISGGEPLLAPSLIAEVFQRMTALNMTGQCLLKVESNLSAFPYAYEHLDESQRNSIRAVAPHVTLHATLHAKPGERDWATIRQGLRLAVDVGFQLYPAIGGGGWSDDDMLVLVGELERVAENLSRRLAVRPFDMSYTTRYERRIRPDEQVRPMPASEVWERILQETMGSDYLAVPRHAVELR